MRQFAPEPTDYDPAYMNHCWHMDIDFTPFENCKKEWRMADDISIPVAKSMYNKAMTGSTNDGTQTLVCLPKYFVPGFPKCGSSQLFRLISSHPLACRPPTKEPHWWTRLHFQYQHRGDPFDKLSVLGYFALFKRCTKKNLQFPDSVTVDGSQSTLWEDSNYEICELPKLVRKVMPSSKFVIIMRQPSSRIYSEYWYFSRMQNKSEIGPGSFHHCIIQEIEVFQRCLSEHNSTLLCVQLHQQWHDKTESACNTRLHVSIYYAHILKWMLVFPKKQFLFLRLEDMSRDPESILRSVWEFLELPIIDIDDALKRVEIKDSSVALKQTYPPMLPQTKLILDKFLWKYTYSLYELIGDEKFLWNDYTV